MAKPLKKPRFDRPNQKGRNDKAGRFIMIPHRILNSTAYASLDLAARGLLQELVMLYTGSNNGSIYLSTLEATARLGLCDKRPAMRAFEDLIDRGFITLTKNAYFAVKAAEASRARCWRLTWHSWPECPTRSKRAPTNEWERYVPAGKTPENKRAERRLKALASYRKAQAGGYFAGVNSTPMEANMTNIPTIAGVNSTPLKQQNGSIVPFPIGGDSTPYIHLTRGCSCLGWWSTPEQAQITGHILLLHIMTLNWLNRGAGNYEAKKIG